jgi:hypothetical protein
MGRLVSLSSTDLSSYVTCPSKVSLAPWSTITVNCVNKTIAFTGCLHLTTQLSLERNHFTGPLPSDWGRLSLLEFLSVAYNKLTRSLPLSMANSTSLTFANFVSNSFSSTILPRVWRINQHRTNPFSGNQLCRHSAEDDSTRDLIEYVSDRQRKPTIYFISLIFVRSSYCRLTHSQLERYHWRHVIHV